MRRVRFITFVETVWQDIGYALRSFFRMPGFTLAALIALTLGIGSTTAVFSAVDRLLFRNLPYPHSERIVSFGMMAPLDTDEFVLSADWFDWRTANTPFESTTTFTPGGDVCDLADDTPLRLQCMRVEATFLTTFGVHILFGRDFTSDDDQPNGPKVAIISYELWQSRYGSEADIVGRTIALNGVPTRVVGVLPRDFEMPNLGRADVLVPQALPFVSHPNSGRPLRAFARLKPNVTIEQARSALQPIFQSSLQWVPEAFRREVTLRVRSLRDRQIQNVKLASWVLFGSVFAVLLIACANVSNLLLARAAARQREFAVRSSIGAGRGRLIRQALTESLVLGFVGGALGCGFAKIILNLIVRIAPEGIPRLDQASLDGRSLVFAVSISVLSGLLFGLAPALRRASAETLMQRGVVGTHGRIRQSLVAIQIAVSLILLTSAGLLIRTLWNLQNVPLGMQTQNVIVAPVFLGPQRYGSPQKQRLFFDELELRLKNMAGFGDVVLSDSVPLGGTVSDITGQLGTHSTLLASLEVEGRPSVGKETGGLVAWRRISPGYFRVLGIPIVRGRAFNEDDRNTNQRVMIISESLAQRLFPNQEAVGKQIRTGQQIPLRTVVGIAANVKNNPVLAGADDPEYYVPRKDDDTEGASPQAAIILRTSLGAGPAGNAIRATVAALDPAVPVSVYTMEQRVSQLAASPRFNAALLGWFAAVGVLLAAVGLYGVISFLVTQRTQEIGVRLALGATSRNIVSLVFSAAMRWTGAGIVMGVLGSLVATRLFRTLLFKVEEQDLWTLSVTIIVMLGAAGFAAWLPSRRASRTDPIVALKQE
jgi:predicted permease